MTTKITTLQIGQVHLSEQNEEILSTLNNSTIVCIYDSKLMIAGLCHFLFPSEGYVKDKSKNAQGTPFLFGDFAIPTLLGLFKKKGSDRNDLQISILGSSTISSVDLSNKTATENILCAERWIEKFGLNLKQKKTGLPEGMQVRINSNSGGVFLKHLSTNKGTEPMGSDISSAGSHHHFPDASSFSLKSPASSTTSATQRNLTKNNVAPLSSHTSGVGNLNSPGKSTMGSTTSSLPRSSTSTATFSTTKTPATTPGTNSPLRSTTPSTSTMHSSPSNLSSHKNAESGANSSSMPLRSGAKNESSSSKSNEKIRVLVVDDSKTIRQLLTSIIETSPQLQIVGQAADAFEAETLRVRLRPDVMTLDIHMPEKDGVTYLEEVLSKDPLPVVMVSDLSLKEASPVMKALELGAFEYFQKPAASELAVLAPELINIIKAAYEGRDKIKKQQNERKQKHNVQLNKKNLPPSTIKADSLLKLIAIGASTGGPEAIRKVLNDFPEKCPPVIIVQHMPAKFTKTFADSLNQTCRVKVKEAENGDILEPSTVYIAPGGFQMAILESGGRYQVSITDDPPVNRFKPSVDYTFNTLERIDFKGQVNAAILTGMGSDGAYGILGLRRKGWFTIAQDEATCVVYGMPRAAVEYNAIDIALPIDKVAEVLIGQKKKSSQSA